MKKTSNLKKKKNDKPKAFTNFFMNKEKIKQL